MKHDMADRGGPKDGQYMTVSIDDKAYLRPGTEFGVKGARNQVVYNNTDAQKAKALPQHAFSNPKLYVIPSSFRFMTKKI